MTPGTVAQMWDSMVVEDGFEPTIYALRAEYKVYPGFPQRARRTSDESVNEEAIPKPGPIITQP